MTGVHVRFEISPEDFLAHLTEAVYEVALKHGINVPFVKIELDFYEALRNVIRRDMRESPACGASKECVEALRYEPLQKPNNITSLR